MLALACMYSYDKNQVPLRTIPKHHRRKTKTTLQTCDVIRNTCVAIHIEMSTE